MIHLKLLREQLGHLLEIEGMLLLNLMFIFLKKQKNKKGTLSRMAFAPVLILLSVMFTNDFGMDFTTPIYQYFLLISSIDVIEKLNSYLKLQITSTLLKRLKMLRDAIKLD